MSKDNSLSTISNPELIEALNEISNFAINFEGIDPEFEGFIKSLRKIFIFDNVVLYLIQDNGFLEPVYARAIGRGRTSESDLAWGETIANESLNKKSVISRKEIEGDYQLNRMNMRDFLGLPLIIKNKKLGSLVFVRYGGPPYLPDQIMTCEHVARILACVIDRVNLRNVIGNLEHELNIKKLQDDFVATISHELRTPIGFIKGYTTTLLRDDTSWDDESRREFLTIIDDETDRLRELIDNLLDSSRLQSGTLSMDFQTIRVDTILKDFCTRSCALNNQAIDLDISKQDVEVNADPTRITQVLENLLSNARKYAPDSRVKISLTTENSHAHISICDQGPGIDQEHIQHIFDRFYRVPNSTKSVRGTGLGLFICRRIIQAHNGEIYAESELGKGSIFHIMLPMYSPGIT